LIKIGIGQAPQAEKERYVDLPSLVNSIATGELSLEESQEVSVRPGARLGEILVLTGKTTHEKVITALQKQKKEVERKRLGDLLVRAVATSSVKVQRALDIQKEQPERRKLGDILMEIENITKEEIESALQQQEIEEVRDKIGEILVRQGIVSAKDVAEALRLQKSLVRFLSQLDSDASVAVNAKRLDRQTRLIKQLEKARAELRTILDSESGLPETLVEELKKVDKLIDELYHTGLLIGEVVAEEEG